MANFPAMPLFTDAYLGDTRHLTTLQHGAYLLMLMVAWRTSDCSLPNDDLYLARITGMDRRTWNSNRDTLLAFWRLDDQQKWVQARLKDERNYVEQKRNINSASGKASALKRKNRASTDVQRNANENPTPTLTPIPVKEVRKEEKCRGTRFALTDPPPDWIQFCQTQRPDLNAGIVFDGFRDYWIAKAGRDGMKLDWSATWRNWVRNQKSNSGGNYGKPAKTKLEIAAEGIARSTAKRKRREQGEAQPDDYGVLFGSETLRP